MVSFVECSGMGCHIDGFLAVVAHTFVLREGPLTGRAAEWMEPTLRDWLESRKED